MLERFIAELLPILISYFIYWFIYLFYKRYYIKIPTHKLAIVSSRLYEIKDSLLGKIERKGVKTMRGGVCIFPVLETIKYVDLSIRMIPIKVENIKTLTEKNIEFQSNVIVRFCDNFDSLALAITYSDENGNETIRLAIQKHIILEAKKLIRTQTLDTIRKHQIEFNQTIQTTTNRTLKEMGLKVLDFSIETIREAS